MVNIARKFLIMLNNLPQKHFKLFQKEQFEEATGDLICNSIADKITKVSEDLQRINSETVTNEHDKEIPKERDISSGKKKKENYWWSQIKPNLDGSFRSLFWGGGGE